MPRAVFLSLAACATALHVQRRALLAPAVAGAIGIAPANADLIDFDPEAAKELRAMDPEAGNSQFEMCVDGCEVFEKREEQMRKRGGTLRISAPANPSSLDPATGGAGSDHACACDGFTSTPSVECTAMQGRSNNESAGRTSWLPSAPTQSCMRPSGVIGLWTAVYKLSANGVDTFVR